MSFDPVSRLDGQVAVITGGLAIGQRRAPGCAGRYLRAAAPQGRRRAGARIHPALLRRPAPHGPACRHRRQREPAGRRRGGEGRARPPRHPQQRRTHEAGARRRPRRPDGRADRRAAARQLPRRVCHHPRLRAAAQGQRRRADRQREFSIAGFTGGHNSVRRRQGRAGRGGRRAGYVLAPQVRVVSVSLGAWSPVSWRDARRDFSNKMASTTPAGPHRLACTAATRRVTTPRFVTGTRIVVDGGGICDEQDIDHLRRHRQPGRPEQTSTCPSRPPRSPTSAWLRPRRAPARCTSMRGDPATASPRWKSSCTARSSSASAATTAS